MQSLMMVGTWLGSAKLIDDISERKNFFVSSLIALPAMIATAIYLPFLHEHFYSQQLLTQPYHNITYTGMRFISIFAMIIFFRMFEKYLKKNQMAALDIAFCNSCIIHICQAKFLLRFCTHTAYFPDD